MDMGIHARKHSRHDRGAECEADRTLSVLWNIWQLCGADKVFRIREAGIVEE